METLTLEKAPQGRPQRSSPTKSVWILGALGVSTGMLTANSQEDDEDKGTHEDVRNLHSPDVSVSVLEP